MPIAIRRTALCEVNIAERPGTRPVRTTAFPQGRGMLSEPRRGEFMPRVVDRTQAGRARSVVDEQNAVLLMTRKYGNPPEK